MYRYKDNTTSGKKIIDKFFDDFQQSLIHLKIADIVPIVNGFYAR